MTDALLSIHDVTPAHLPRVLELVDWLETAGGPPTLLLVVPGLAWSDDQLATLRRLAASGYELAGHGWRHAAPSPTSLHHRLHGAILSRDQAEHLSRSRAELVRLVTDCHAWFASAGLPSPDVYVPPAWALGSLTVDDLAGLPFTWYESLSGFVAPALGRRVTLPLIGFEADTPGRRLGLEAWNRSNALAARASRRPVRVSIHPDDLHLRLAGRLREAVEGGRFRFLETRAWLRERLGRRSLEAGERAVVPDLQPARDPGIGPSASKTTPLSSPSTQRT